MSYDALRRRVQQFSRAAEWLTVSLFTGIFVLFIVAIVQRYVLARPVNWVDEGVLILFLWSTFLTEALVLKEREAVTFDVLYDLCGPSGRRVIGWIASALVAVLFTLAAPTIWSYVTFLWRERTSALEWRLDYVYSCFLVYWVAVIVRAIDKFVMLSRDGWEAQVSSAAPDEKSNVLG